MTFSAHAITTAESIINEAPPLEVMFEILREFADRGVVSDFSLVVESFGIKGSIHELVEFAERNKKRDEIMEMLQWCATQAGNREEVGLDEAVKAVREWLKGKEETEA